MRSAGWRRVPVWVWWIPVVWIISFPWTDFTREPQWHRVHAAPFSDPADRLRDLLLNMMLFVPFGYSFAGRQEPFAILRATGIAVAVSVSAEALQLFSTERFPSGTDVTAAAAGALAGAYWARLGRKRDE
jgi:glycopeptide antibiotics resistance protein